MTPAPQGRGGFLYLGKEVIEMTGDDTGTIYTLWYATNLIIYEEKNNV